MGALTEPDWTSGRISTAIHGDSRSGVRAVLGSHMEKIYLSAIFPIMCAIDIIHGVICCRSRNTGVGNMSNPVMK